MHILRVDLDNVKSYAHASVVFTGGTNAICGHNGAGKSTLLEAIGFALFDFLPMRQDDFVREGEKTATVTVHMAASDERVYHVIRRCGSSSQYYIYDPELEQKLTDGKGETVMWLHDFLGVELTADLQSLFRDAVGVPQGLLTAAFLDKSSNRKNTFNPLLRVDEYERAWAGLREPQSQLKRRIDELEVQIAGFEAETRNLPELREKAEDLQVALDEGEEQQTALTAELEAVTERKTALEAVRAQLEALDKAVTQANAQVESVSVRLGAAQAALERAEAAQVVVDETGPGHQAYLEAQSNLQALVGRRVERDRLVSERRFADKKLALLHQRIKALDEQLGEITQAEAEMEKLRPEVEAQERLESDLDAARRAAERLEAATRNLAQEQTRLLDLQEKLDAVQAGLKVRAGVAADFEALQAAQAETNEQYTALTARLAAEQVEQQQLASQIAQTETRLRKSEEKLAQSQQQLADLEQKLTGVQAELVELAGVEAQIADLQVELEGMEVQQSELTAQIAAHQVSLDQIAQQSGVLEASQEAECPVCKQPLSPEHRAELLANYQEQRVQLQNAVAAAEEQQSQLKKSRSQKQRELQKLEKRVKKLPRPGTDTEIEGQIAQQHQVVEDTQTVVAEERHLLETSRARSAEIAGTLHPLQEQMAVLEKTQQQQRARYRDLEQQLSALPRPGDAESLASQIVTQERAVADIEEQVQALAPAPAAVEQLQGELADLGNPRRAFQRAADIAAARDKVMAQLDALQSDTTNLEQQIAGLDEDLVTYADLDAEIAARRAAQAENEAAHQRYLQHIREAELLTQHKESVETAGVALKDAKTERDGYVAARDSVAKEYDAEGYAELTRSHSQLGADLAALAERLRQQQARLKEIRSEIEHLKGVQTRLNTAEQEREEQQELLLLLQYLRETLRSAGPEVTRALVELISLHADRLYSDIMQQNRSRLQWTPDYDIVLSTDGRERVFQQLSGGEQMSAALAVRLALLREISTINVAFFDEPTANLDGERRANLAKQILSVKGFSQLFVISHDDTFEQDTDNIVRIEKIEGFSQLLEEGV